MHQLCREAEEDILIKIGTDLVKRLLPPFDKGRAVGQNCRSGLKDKDGDRNAMIVTVHKDLLHGQCKRRHLSSLCEIHVVIVALTEKHNL